MVTAITITGNTAIETKTGKEYQLKRNISPENTTPAPATKNTTTSSNGGISSEESKMKSGLLEQGKIAQSIYTKIEQLEKRTDECVQSVRTVEDHLCSIDSKLEKLLQRVLMENNNNNNNISSSSSVLVHHQQATTTKREEKSILDCRKDDDELSQAPFKKRKRTEGDFATTATTPDDIALVSNDKNPGETETVDNGNYDLDYFTMKPASGSSSRQSFSRTSWEARVEELRQFRIRKGHCNVPQTYKGGLGAWVSAQRYQYKVMMNAGEQVSSSSTSTSSVMTKARVEILEKLGFVWSLRRRYTWEERFEELREYVQTYGTTDVTPSRHKQLWTWTCNQRQAYRRGKEGKGPSMDPTRIKSLESIGFQWIVQRQQENETRKMHTYEMNEQQQQQTQGEEEQQTQGNFPSLMMNSQPRTETPPSEENKIQSSNVSQNKTNFQNEDDIEIIEKQPTTAQGTLAALLQESVGDTTEENTVNSNVSEISSSTVGVLQKKPAGGTIVTNAVALDPKSSQEEPSNVATERIVVNNGDTKKASEDPCWGEDESISYGDLNSIIEKNAERMKCYRYDLKL